MSINVDAILFYSCSKCSAYFFSLWPFLLVLGLVDIIAVAISIAIDDIDANILIARISDRCPIKYNMLVVHERNGFLCIICSVKRSDPRI